MSGHRGSGTIFFSNCSLSCCFCQNYPISQLGHGRETSVEELAGSMLELQARGAHNINLVTATHFAPQWAQALVLARGRGLRVPLVYNTGGFERVEILAMLEGMVDVYLPDMKYADDRHARALSGAPGYVDANRAAVREMHRQVGRLRVDSSGVAARGLIVRHLVLPGGVSGTREVLEFLAGLSPRVHVSLMGQYFPAHRAPEFPGLNRKLHRREYADAVAHLDRLNLRDGWLQSIEG